MANAYLMKKWTRLYKTFDLNKDDVLTVDDANLFSDRFIESNKLKGEQATEFKTKFLNWFRDFLLKGEEKMTEDGFVKKMREEYQKDGKEFEKSVRKDMSVLVSITDVNKDNMISKEEVREALKAMGLVTFDEKYFNAYPQIKPGFIEANLFLQSWVEYCCNSDDRDVSNLEKARLYGFRMIDSI
ncbi:sarcoplasmic calcium-binding protein-like [Mytilus californianus]|uniref:sarcoplasmic calcium-binding protein-like n=1 Tax=Mytilus californianus TaxID=6549 RepID=UPI0022467FE1|nr:sarcoplasmic calcium-binding protein-like [Mytilus californianus]